MSFFSSHALPGAGRPQFPRQRPQVVQAIAGSAAENAEARPGGCYRLCRALCRPDRLAHGGRQHDETGAYPIREPRDLSTGRSAAR